MSTFTVALVYPTGDIPPDREYIHEHVAKLRELLINEGGINLVERGNTVPADVAIVLLGYFPDSFAAEVIEVAARSRIVSCFNLRGRPAPPQGILRWVNGHRPASEVYLFDDTDDIMEHVRRHLLEAGNVRSNVPQATAGEQLDLRRTWPN